MDGMKDTERERDLCRGVAAGQEDRVERCVESDCVSGQRKEEDGTERKTCLRAWVT